jgi:hypothetical protein
MASDDDRRGAAPPSEWPSNVIPLKADWLYHDAPASPADPPGAAATEPSEASPGLWDGSASAQRAYDPSFAPESHSWHRLAGPGETVRRDRQTLFHARLTSPRRAIAAVGVIACVAAAAIVIGTRFASAPTAPQHVVVQSPPAASDIRDDLAHGTAALAALNRAGATPRHRASHRPRERRKMRHPTTPQARRGHRSSGTQPTTTAVSESLPAVTHGSSQTSHTSSPPSHAASASSSAGGCGAFATLC